MSSLGIRCNIYPLLSNDTHCTVCCGVVWYGMVLYGVVQASGDKALYVWRPVPPSSAFVAMGMVVTTTEEPPPQDSISCVPRRWVVESTFKPIKVTKHMLAIECFVVFEHLHD